MDQIHMTMLSDVEDRRPMKVALVHQVGLILQVSRWKAYSGMQDWLYTNEQQPHRRKVCMSIDALVVIQ